MLSALQKQIEILALDYDNSFEKHIKARWHKKEIPQGFIKELKEFIKMMTKIEKRIFGLYVWLPDSSKIKEVGSHFLTYMYEPDDFIPATEKNGLFGYIDDAYLAALFFELMLEEIQNAKQLRILKKDKDLLKKSIRLRKKAKAIIPDEAAKIEKMMGELFEGDSTTYNKLFNTKVSA